MSETFRNEGPLWPCGCLVGSTGCDCNVQVLDDHDEPLPGGVYFDTRWACPSCGRFIPDASIRSWDEIDPSAYYGVRGETRGTCSWHGEVEPVCVPIRERPLPADGGGLVNERRGVRRSHPGGA